MYKLPVSNQWKQVNSGEVFGSLFSTRNIDLNQDGYLRLARKSTALFMDTANLGSLCSIDWVGISGASGYYFMTSDKPFRWNGAESTTLTALTATGLTGGLGFDGTAWQQRWYYSQDTDFRYYDGSVSSTLGSLTTALPHPVCVSQDLNQLAIGDGNLVKMYNTSHSLITTITLPSNYEVRWILWKNNQLYIGTKNSGGGKGALFLATGAATSASAMYEWDGNWFFSGCNYMSTIACVSSNGQLLEFNGGGFNVLANFPVYAVNASWYAGTGFSKGRVEHKGMVADGPIIYINIDGYVGGLPNGYLPNQPSGLWQFDPKVGLYHLAGLAHNKVSINGATTASADSSTDLITVSSSYTSPTGTLVWYNTGGVGGLQNQSYYFIIRDSSTTFKLATSYDNAIAGTAIDLTSNGSNPTFYFQENDEFGNVNGGIQQGAVQLVSDLDVNSGGGGMVASLILYGDRTNLDVDGSDTDPTINTLVKGFNVGSFVTQKIYSVNVDDIWQKAFVKVNRLLEGCDKVTLKYRVENKKGYPLYSGSAFKCTWVNATSFTTTMNLSDVVDGEEIEFIGGRCAGYNVHISGTPVNNAGTWTVTIDETLPNVTASDSSYFVIDNWVKAENLTGASVNKNLLEAPIAKPSKWIQLKIELRGTSEPVVEEVQIISEVHKPSA